MRTTKLHQPKNFNYNHLKPLRLAQIDHEDYQCTVSCELNETEKGLLLDFIQTITTNNNKWQEPNVVSDKILYRYFLDSQVNKDELIKFVTTNYTQEKLKVAKTFDFQPIKDLAHGAKYLQVSLPYGLMNPQNPSKKYKDTFRPVKVMLNNCDYSYAFDDYDQFGSEIVNQVFASIVANKIPAICNDLFDRRQVSALAEKLR